MNDAEMWMAGLALHYMAEQAKKAVKRGDIDAATSAYYSEIAGSEYIQVTPDLQTKPWVERGRRRAR